MQMEWPPGRNARRDNSARKHAALCCVLFKFSLLSMFWFALPPFTRFTEENNFQFSWNFTWIPFNKSKTIDIFLDNPYIFEQLGYSRFRICKNQFFAFFLEVPFFESHFLTPKLEKIDFFTLLHSVLLGLVLLKKIAS